jgi:glycosyltransferase involved in cell wall biosynthesis
MIEAEALPLVTVVTPSFNQARFIRATIESVLSQDYPNIEYIIIDGGSTDGTSGVVAPFSDRLTFISEKDLGQADAINKGLRMGRGSIVAYLNSDDVFLPGAVSAAVAELAANPELGAVYGEGYRIDADGNVIARFEVTESYNLWKLVNVSDYILQQTVFWQRSVFDSIGFFDLDLHYGLDWEILMRTGKRYVMGYIPQFMGCLREYPEAKTSAGGAQRFKEIARILRTHSSYRYPPAYVIYGLDTYEKIVCRRIAVMFRWWPRLAHKLQRAVIRISHQIIGKLAVHSQGLYSDGWASTRVAYMLPPCDGRYIEVIVTLPPGPLERQSIVVRNGRRILARESFTTGTFTLNIPVPEDRWDATLSFTIEAERHFTPEGADRRRLCYILEGVRLSNRYQLPGIGQAAAAQFSRPI